MNYPETSLTTTGQQSQKSSPPTAPSREVSMLVARVYSAMDIEQTNYRTLSISSRVTPTPDQRQMLDARMTELAMGLQLSEGAHAKTVVSALINRLLLTYPQSERVSEQEARATLTGYVEALIDLPLWAVHAACQGWVRGEGDGDNRFRPSAADLRKLAQRKCLPFRQEHEKIKRILNAKVQHEPTPEERQRVLERFQTVLAETICAPKPEQAEGAV